MLAWNKARWVGAACAALLAMTLAACQGSPHAGSGGPSPGGSRSPSGYGAVFLAVDECSSRGRDAFTEVPCRSERAVARVTARYDGKAVDGPTCPARTDFVLHISEDRPSLVGSDGTATGEIPQGYACMRNLEPPHPGDPGGGGGPRTIVGDCVYAAGRGQVRETACDGSGKEKPRYRVAAAAVDRAECPALTALYVTLGGSEPVGCAVRV
ncbi:MULTISPECIES: hypothetical protein [unclassified Streptomyces]|uniref:hypothetical protein n=1 Tax=unclassified Streptomyces TaxID=2593676 RepID=UPI002E81961B|nr:hypothetical protein [Streptomyces sp. NBC_00569]WUB95921.1 hypothetical protein OHO83_28525 [Streptomyces sp. NBC_00569]